MTSWKCPEASIGSYSHSTAEISKKRANSRFRRPTTSAARRALGDVAGRGNEDPEPLPDDRPRPPARLTCRAAGGPVIHNSAASSNRGPAGDSEASVQRRRHTVFRGRTPARSNAKMAEFSPSTDRLATVFGGSGFVGRHIVRALARDGWRIRVAVRRPDLAGFLRPARRRRPDRAGAGELALSDLIAPRSKAPTRWSTPPGFSGSAAARPTRRCMSPAPARLRAPRPRRGPRRSSTSRASAPTRARPTPISPARGAARPPCAGVAGRGHPAPVGHLRS